MRASCEMGDGPLPSHSSHRARHSNFEAGLRVCLMCTTLTAGDRKLQFITCSALHSFFGAAFTRAVCFSLSSCNETR